MKYPSKVTPYKKSDLYKMVLLSKELQNNPLTLLQLYDNCKSDMDIYDYIRILDYLYALRKIDYNDDSGVIIYVD